MKHDEYAQLCKEIRRHDYLYYVKDAPTLSDPVYDGLRRTILAMEEAHPEWVTPASPTQVVGYPVSNQFKKVTHYFSMLSLANTFNAKELMTWIATIPGYTSATDLGFEFKLDGLSLSLTYVNGVLQQAVTRGDGLIGEDVTVNALRCAGIPRLLNPELVVENETVTIRGEVVVRQADYDRINHQMVEKGKKPFVNKRNYASGSLRQKDPDVTAERKLEFIAYSLHSSEKSFETNLAERAEMHQHGFSIAPEVPIANLQTVTTEADWADVLDKLKECRALVDYDIDGIVIKVRSSAIREEMGFRNRSPRWATSYKFPASEGITVLHDVTWQVGRTGAVTPVGNIDPVFVHGTTITNVSLHGPLELARLDLHYGDTVVIKRAGDVIPKLTQVLLGMRKKDAQLIMPPEACPCCGGPLVMQQAVLTCVNDDCLEQVVQTIYYCADRDVFNIQDLGIETIRLLVTMGKIHDIWDLLMLTQDGLVEVLGSEKIAMKLAQELTAARVRPLEKVLAALCIPEVGKGTAQLLAESFGSLEAVRLADKDQLMAVHGIGKVTAAEVFCYWEEDASEGNPIYNKVKATMFQIVNPSVKEPGFFTGKTVCVSGVMFFGLKRKQVESWYTAQGASIVSKPSKNTYLAVFGTKHRDHKLQAAKDVGCMYTVYDENGILETTETADMPFWISPI